MRKTTALFAFVAISITGASSASAQMRFTPQVLWRAPSPPSYLRLSPRVLLRSPVAVAPAPTVVRAEPAPEPARFECRVEDNGAWAPASYSVLRDGEQVASGRCGAATHIEPGTYDVVLTLEETLDRPHKRVRVRASEGGEVMATARFETSILEVRFTKDRMPAAGLAIILRDGQRVGTLGSNVPARLSSGRYEIVARYRTHEQRYTVDLAPEQRRAIIARF